MLIALEYLIKKYSIKPDYVLHVGASTGQEAESYKKNKVHHVTWIEADPVTFEGLKLHLFKYPGQYAINACVSDQDGVDVTFYRTNNEGQSSSILKLGTHKKVHPQVHVIEEIKLITSRLDTLWMQGKIQSVHEFDFLNIDLQGAELLALRGMGEMLRQFKCLYLEVNKAQLYIGCPMIEDIDNYVSSFGFKRVEAKWCGNTNWGDAVYLRK